MFLNQQKQQRTSTYSWFIIGNIGFHVELLVIQHRRHHCNENELLNRNILMKNPKLNIASTNY